MMTFVPVLAQSSADAGGGAVVLLVLLVVLAGWLLAIASMWTVFSKAGQPGWAAIVPIYNTMTMAKVAGRESWWGLLVLVPFVGPFIGLLLTWEVAQRFGASTGVALAAIFLPFVGWPMLAFGDYQYQGAGHGPHHGGGYPTAAGYQQQQQWPGQHPAGGYPAQQWGQAQPAQPAQPAQWPQQAQPQQWDQAQPGGYPPAQPQQWDQAQPGGYPPAQPQQPWGGQQ